MEFWLIFLVKSIRIFTRVIISIRILVIRTRILIDLTIKFWFVHFSPELLFNQIIFLNNTPNFYPILAIRCLSNISTILDKNWILNIGPILLNQYLAVHCFSNIEYTIIESPILAQYCWINIWPILAIHCLSNISPILNKNWIPNIDPILLNQYFANIGQRLYSQYCWTNNNDT